MNILIYFGNQLNPNNGGTERVACMIGDYLSRNGHSIYHLACHSAKDMNSVESWFLPDKIECPTDANKDFIKYLIKQKGIEVIINEGAFSDSVYLFSHEHIPAHIRIISHIHFDPIGDYINFYKSLNLPLSGIKFNKACKNTLKWIKAPYNKHMSLVNKKKRFTYMLENSDKVIFLTQTHVHDFARIVKNGDFSKLSVIQNPLTFEKPIDSSQKKLNNIIFVGRLDYSSKRIDRILRVWALLQSSHLAWTLTIVGDGDDRLRLQRISTKLKLDRINFAGKTNVTPYYENAKLILMTSNYEGCPMVITEAMAYGVVPVVMNTFSGARDMINDNVNGCLTRPFDIENMVDTLSKLIKDNNHLKLLSNNAIATASAIDNDKILSHWENVIS